MTTSLSPHVVTLGIAGGPRIWPATASGAAGEDSAARTGHRPAGIATAVVVGGAVYLVDAGHGVFTQMHRAGLRMDDVRGIFITHQHSDHTIDLNELLVFGLFERSAAAEGTVTTMGPGDRQVLPPVSPLASTPPQPVAAERPTPGTEAMVNSLIAAHATDLNDRILDALRPSPTDVFTARDIAIPDEIGFHANDNPFPAIEPFEIFRDDRVVVTATLVEHPPVAPAFAFRFDTAEGSVTISGDTRPSENLVRLADGTDLLMHEVIDFDWVERTYGGRGDETSEASIDHHRKSHTSPQQAGDIAARAGAGSLLLHHRVPGNADPAVWQQAAETFDGPLLIPSELDVISFGSAAESTTHRQEVLA